MKLRKWPVIIYLLICKYSNVFKGLNNRTLCLLYFEFKVFSAFHNVASNNSILVVYIINITLGDRKGKFFDGKEMYLLGENDPEEKQSPKKVR